MWEHFFHKKKILFSLDNYVVNGNILIELDERKVSSSIYVSDAKASAPNNIRPHF